MSVSVKQQVLPRLPEVHLPRPPAAIARAASRAATPALATGPTLADITRFLFTFFGLVALGFGWWLAQHETFTPKEGAGYWIGIAGGTTLLVQLAYPLRKRARFMRRMGSAPTWFRLHMALGVIGPLLILYHSNYSLGAPNSNVALFAMLIVAVSGIVGRYFYGKVHNGLYGAHTNLQDILEEATALLSVIETDTGGSGGVVASRLTSFSEEILKPSRSALASLGKALRLAFIMPFVRHRMLKEVQAAVAYNKKRMHWSNRDCDLHYGAAKVHVHNYLDSVVKASELALYERLFAMWHLLHMPLFFLLIVTGVTHVIAVHLY
jgi:hypothetical protein